MSFWNEVLTELRQKRQELGDGEIWYRGHASADWELRPAVVRAAHGREHERNLYNAFVRHMPRVLPKQRTTTDWENLFEMQHYGVPTRLLDWTESFAIALFFALSAEYPRSTIFLLEPYRLNRASLGQNELYDPTDRTPNDLHQTIFDNKDPNTLPFAVKAPFQNERMFAQRAVFTIYRNHSAPLDQIDACRDAVKRIDFGPEERSGAKEFLDLAGIDQRSVFPDIAGFVQFVRKVLPID